MKVRIHTLWRMPVYCMAASYISALVTVYLGGYFFLTRTPCADGVTVSIDPVRSMIFDGVLFLIVLLVGGLWIFRSMTKMELGISAGITIGIYLLLALAQRFIPGFQPGVTEAFIYTWQGESQVYHLEADGSRGFGESDFLSCPAAVHSLWTKTGRLNHKGLHFADPFLAQRNRG